MLHLDVDRVPPISHIPSTATNELPTVIGDATTFLQIFCHSILGFRLIAGPAKRSDPRISADLSRLPRFFTHKSDVFLALSRLVSRGRDIYSVYEISKICKYFFRCRTEFILDLNSIIEGFIKVNTGYELVDFIKLIYTYSLCIYCCFLVSKVENRSIIYHKYLKGRPHLKI